MTGLEKIRELSIAWQGADACLKVLIGVVLAIGLFGWTFAIIECLPKRREISKFLNTNGWKIK